MSWTLLHRRMQSEREREERKLEESKARLKTADERRKTAVSEVCPALPTRVGAARGRWRQCRRDGMRRPVCPLMVGEFSGGSAAERDRTSARGNVRSGAAARREPAKVHAKGEGGLLLASSHAADDRSRQAGAERAAFR